MKNILLIFVLTIGVASVSSCVSNKKYRAAKSKIAMLQSDSSSLAGQVSRLNKQITEMEGKLGNMEASNEYTSAQLNMSKEELAKQRQRLVQLQNLIAQQQKNTEALRKKIADALVAFNSSQLTVSMKNGKVYVSMQESLLFPSGSAVVNPKGKEALATLSSVLNQNMDINVEVEGHTDSIAITNKTYRDNWDLSVARSTSISRIMIDDYNVSPGRIKSSGRSKYEPLADNETPEGRQRNRRTEIILEPKLDELMKLIEGN